MKGSMADLHEYLVRKGYSYHKTKTQGDRKKLIYKKGNAQVEIKLVEKGRSAQTVHRRVSANMVQTREHGTPDTYKLRKRKRRASTLPGGQVGSGLVRDIR